MKNNKKKNFNVDLPAADDLISNVDKSEKTAEEFADAVARNAKKLLGVDKSGATSVTLENFDGVTVSEVCASEKKTANAEEVARTEVAEEKANVQENSPSVAQKALEETDEISADDNAVSEDENVSTYREMSPGQLVARRFFRSKLSIVGIIMIVFLLLFSFLGPVVYNRWGETEVDRTPTPQETSSQYTYVNDKGETITVTEIVTIVTDNTYAAPGLDHFLGTDDQGYDIFVRLMYGGRISLMIGFIVVILETLIGVLLGGLAGYFGGWVDQVIMRIVDIFNCIPTLPILLIASAVIDSWQLEADQRIYVLMVVITLFSWSGVARLVRGQILSLREQEYITATEVMGLPTWRKIFVHLISNVMPQLIVSMTLGLGSVILYESTLSYLGLGVQLPKAAWGTMIASANDRVNLIYHMNMWLPAGLLIVVAVLGFNFVGDGLRDAMDPKAKK